MGAEIPDGVLAYKSRDEPVPLSELEKLLVVTACSGNTGWHHMLYRAKLYAPHLSNYSGVADGFTLAKGARNLAEAVAWLELVGSKEAQEAFNALKGSIPVRTDVDKGKLGVYQRWSMASFHHDALLASCVLGEAAPDYLSARIERCDQHLCDR